MTWEEFVKESEKYGWYLIEPKKEDVELVCKGFEYQLFPLKSKEFVTYEDLPLRYYRNYNALFYDSNDVTQLPRLIQMNISFEKMLLIMKGLK